MKLLSGVIFLFPLATSLCSRSQWPRGLRRWSADARLLRLWVRIRLFRDVVECGCVYERSEQAEKLPLKK